MLNVLCVFILLLSARSNVDGKLFSRCELAKELLDIQNATVESVKRFVCIAEYSSGYDTSYFEENSFGIFNISRDACAIEASGGSCNVTCGSLVDDNIENDFMCGITGAINNSVDNYCTNNAETTFDDCSFKSFNDQFPDEPVDEDFLTTTEATDESIQQQDEPLDLENYDINNDFDTKSLNLVQVNLIKNLVKRDPKSNVKYIFLFV